MLERTFAHMWLRVHRGWKDSADLEEGDRVPGDKGSSEIDLNFIYLFFSH